MNHYYTDTLSAQILERCYEIAPPRIRQYFKAEIKFVIESISRADTVLELGCGYGRVLNRLLDSASHVFTLEAPLFKTNPLMPLSASRMEYPPSRLIR
jgi:2-polyprenyl-6-hydroxyphenyl methylase/3-demethylubiquinone-9 3-methyltransferase